MKKDKLQSEPLRAAVLAYVKKKYKTEADYPWKRDQESAVLRHKDNKKWYGLIMKVGREKIGLSGDGVVDVLNVKIDDQMFHDTLIRRNGYFPAYHMNKRCWITILLDGTVPCEEVCRMIDVSYDATASRKQKKEADRKLGNSKK